MMAPMMPHLAEECWQALGHESLVAEARLAGGRAGAAAGRHRAPAGAGQRQEARRADDRGRAPPTPRSSRRRLRSSRCSASSRAGRRGRSSSCRTGSSMWWRRARGPRRWRRSLPCVALRRPRRLPGPPALRDRPRRGRARRPIFPPSPSTSRSTREEQVFRNALLFGAARRRRRRRAALRPDLPHDRARAGDRGRARHRHAERLSAHRRRLLPGEGHRHRRIALRRERHGDRHLHALLAELRQHPRPPRRRGPAGRRRWPS